jgi:hypothetical protein
MAKKKSSSTAALVEHRDVSDEEHPDRLPIEETWPVQSDAADNSSDGCAYTPDDADDGTEPFAHREDITTPYQEIGLSSEGPFIAPAPVTPPDAPTTSKRPKQTVASMPRELAFAKFRDSLCFKFGFTLETDASGHTHNIQVVDVSDAKGSAKRALAVSSMADLELRK